MNSKELTDFKEKDFLRLDYDDVQFVYCCTGKNRRAKRRGAYRFGIILKEMVGDDLKKIHLRVTLTNPGKDIGLEENYVHDGTKAENAQALQNYLNTQEVTNSRYYLRDPQIINRTAIEKIKDAIIDLFKGEMEALRLKENGILFARIKGVGNMEFHFTDNW